LNDCVVKLIACHADGFRINDTAEGDDGDFSGTAADVDDHVSAWLTDWKTCAECCGHWLFDQVNFAGACGLSGLFYGALFNLRDPERDTDDDARANEGSALACFCDEVLQHLLSDFEVSDNAVFQRTNRLNRTRSSS